MFKLPISLGIRYLTSSKGAYGSFYSIISIIGLTIGVGALIIVLSEKYKVLILFFSTLKSSIFELSLKFTLFLIRHKYC